MIIVFLFFVLILFILFTSEPTNLIKRYSRIPEKHDQTSINLTNVFNFIGYNSARFEEIICLCANHILRQWVDINSI